MIVTREKEEDLFVEMCVPAVFAMFMATGGISFLFDAQWVSLGATIGGLFWLILSFRIVPPAFAGLVLRFGSRVIFSENIRYFRVVDGRQEDINIFEFNDPNFNPDASDIKTEIVSVEYLMKKEGWTFICPIVEKIVKISLRQQQQKINGKMAGESEDAYWNRAESFSTAEGVNIFPEIFFSYKVISPGKILELNLGVNENGESPFLMEMLHNLVVGGTREVLATMKIREALSRKIEDENGNSVPVGEKIKGEIIKAPTFGGLGAELLILRIVDIKFKKDAQDVLDALEAVKKKELEREAEVIEADTKLEVQKRASETLVNKSQAELTEARNKALAKNADIAAFVGKAVDGKTTVEDGKAYAQYQIGLEVAKSFATGTKVIIPAGDVSKVMAGLVNVFEASKPDASKT